MSTDFCQGMRNKLSSSKQTIAQHEDLNHAFASTISLSFSGRWGGGRKKRITLTHRMKTLPDADRQVSSQPLMFSKSVFNLRKLSEMPIHLIYSGLSDRLASEVLFNFEWIYGKVRGQSLSEVLEDYVVALEVRPDLDVRWE